MRPVTVLIFLISILYVTAFDFKYISNYIAKNQYPRQLSLCSQKRLLVLHYPDFSFEGTGSILKWVMIGLAEALHSNRTLIWGRYIPNFFTRGVHTSCFNTSHGGLYNCLFHRISACSLADISPEELKQLGMNGYDDSDRVSLSQPRRGLAMYMPPPQFRHFRGVEVFWPSALAAFVFRPKVQLIGFPLPDSFESNMSGRPAVTYCAHIRHGDVSTLEEEYPNRQVFNHTSYYHALREMAYETEDGPPDVIYLATDDVSAAGIVEQWQSWWSSDITKDRPQSTCGTENDLQSCGGDSGRPPMPAFSVRRGIRRSQFGAHYFAAKGGCEIDSSNLRRHCILAGVKLAQIFKDTEGHNEHEEVPIVAFEAIQDINLLSQCNGIVGTATSHFTTVSMLLAWANIFRTHTTQIGAQVQPVTAPNIIPKRFKFLDESGILSGRLESSYMLGKLSYAHLDGRGSERWAHLQFGFADTEVMASVDKPLIYADPSNFLMPRAPNYFFDEEASRWRGTDSSKTANKVCSTDLSIARILYLGRNLSVIHPGVAMGCLELARDLISSSPLMENNFIAGLDLGADETLAGISKLLKSIRNRNFGLYMT